MCICSEAREVTPCCPTSVVMRCSSAARAGEEDCVRQLLELMLLHACSRGAGVHRREAFGAVGRHWAATAGSCVCTAVGHTCSLQPPYQHSQPANESARLPTDLQRAQLELRQVLVGLLECGPATPCGQGISRPQRAEIHHCAAAAAVL